MMRIVVSTLDSSTPLKAAALLHVDEMVEEAFCGRWCRSVGAPVARSRRSVGFEGEVAGPRPGEPAASTRRHGVAGEAEATAASCKRMARASDQGPGRWRGLARFPESMLNVRASDRRRRRAGAVAAFNEGKGRAAGNPAPASRWEDRASRLRRSIIWYPFGWKNVCAAGDELGRVKLIAMLPTERSSMSTKTLATRALAQVGDANAARYKAQIAGQRDVVEPHDGELGQETSTPALLRRRRQPRAIIHCRRRPRRSLHAPLAAGLPAAFARSLVRNRQGMMIGSTPAAWQRARRG